MMKITLLGALLIAASLVCSARAEAKPVRIAWRTNYSSALAEAKKTGKPVFIDIYTDWCTACKYLDRTTYIDSRFVAKSRDWVMLKLNAESQPNVKVVQRYKVDGFPTLIFADAQGKTLGLLAGVGSSHWTKWLGPAMDKAQRKMGVLSATNPILGTMSRPLVKICGTTSVEDAMQAQRVGADFLGVIALYPPSPRNVDLAVLSAISSQISIPLALVTVDQNLKTLRRLVKNYSPAILQLHGDESPELVREFASTGIQVWKAIHGDDAALLQAAQLYTQAGASALVVDARQNTPRGTVFGGTGQVANWKGAKKLVAAGYRVVLAGGLSSENLADAIKTAAPWAVDVVSGVEARKGVKDLEKMRGFVLAAHTAKRRAPRPSRARSRSTTAVSAAQPLASAEAPSNSSMIPTPNGAGALLALLFLLQFAGVVAFLGGSFYLLWTLNRSAKALERLAELSAIQMARHDAFYGRGQSPSSGNVAPTPTAVEVVPAPSATPSP